MMSLRNRYALRALAAVSAALLFPAQAARAQTHAAEQDGCMREVSDRHGAQAAIQSRVTVRAVEAPLEDLLDHLQAITPIRFEPVWATLNQPGLDPRQLVTLDLSQRPITEALDRIVEQVATEFDPAAWQIGIDGRIQIGPKSRLNERAEIVVYDLHDLVFDIPDFVDAPPIDLQAAMQQGQDSAQPPFSELGNEPRDEPAPRNVQEIADIVSMLIEPEQWMRNGGEGAMMRIWNQQLIVKAPRYVLRQIDEFTR